MTRPERTVVDRPNKSAGCEACGSTNRTRLNSSEKSGHRCEECGLVTWEQSARHVVSFRDAAKSERQARIRWSRLSTYLNHPRPTILDVGCGGSPFLSIAARRGWRCHGVERAENVSAATTRCGCTVTPLDDWKLSYPTGFFDAVTAWYVLDDVADPQRLFEECRRVLKPSGILAIECRNARSWQTTFGDERREQFWNTSGDRLFTTKALQTLAARNGFAPCIGPGFGRLEQLSLRMASYAFLTQLGSNSLRVLNVPNEVQMFFRAGDPSELSARRNAA